jgi:hypothetical protein
MNTCACAGQPARVTEIEGFVSDTTTVTQLRCRLAKLHHGCLNRQVDRGDIRHYLRKHPDLHPRLSSWVTSPERVGRTDGRTDQIRSSTCYWRFC